MVANQSPQHRQIFVTRGSVRDGCFSFLSCWCLTVSTVGRSWPLFETWCCDMFCKWGRFKLLVAVRVTLKVSSRWTLNICPVSDEQDLRGNHTVESSGCKLSLQNSNSDFLKSCRMWITDVHPTWVVVSSSASVNESAFLCSSSCSRPKPSRLLSASPAVQCFTRLRWPEPTSGSVQEA